MRRTERGQMSMVLVLAVPALLVVALIIITVVGDGMVKRTETSTAADAAALAAAEEWRTYVGQAIVAADGQDPDDAIDRLRALLTTDAALLDSSGIGSRARELAAANNAKVTSLSIRRAGAGIEFAVETRNLDTVNETSIRPTSRATAVVELTGGACWRGARLGLVYHGDCLGWSDLKDALTPDPPANPPVDPGDDGQPSEPTPTADADPVSLVRLRADTRLAA